jgi:hypothetical protein
MAANEKDLETECLVYGQIGLTYSVMGDTKTALEFLEVFLLFRLRNVKT